MNKNIILLLLVLLLSAGSVLARRRHWIPGPVISGISSAEMSPATIVTVQGQGFIKGLPEAHKVWLIATESKATKIPVTAVSATATELQILMPHDIAWGDYDLLVKIQTRLLASHKSQSPQRLLIRPPAPTRPSLSYEVIASEFELHELLTSSSFQGNELFYELDADMKVGINQLRAYYIRDAYKSIKSEPVSFYYLPQVDFEHQLNVESESPLKSYAVTKPNLTEEDTQLIYDVSSITKKEVRDLYKHFYLRTPLEPRYLERTIELKPLYIEAIHVLEPESAVLRNRSNKDLTFSKCSLSDSLKEYFKFTTEKILAHSSLTINKNLGLNNTTPDSLIFTCNGEVLDQFDYDKVDAAGMGIKK